MEYFAIIVAGGSGKRFGSSTPKQFLPLKGLPVLMRTLEAFHAYKSSIKLIVTLPAEYIEMWQLLCREFKFNIEHHIVTGGETRFHSVLNGLNCISSDGIVAIHDAVRPLVSNETLQRCFETATRVGNAVPIVTSADSIRELNGDASSPVNRDNYVMVQTPQVFKTNLLKEAYKQEYIHEFTDDASVIERMGTKIILVEGNRENIKITTQTDMIIAEALIKNKF